MEIWMHQLLHWLALPQFGLSTVFVVSFISATLLPLGSEPAVFGLVKLNPEIFSGPRLVWPPWATPWGGAVSWWMGLGAPRPWTAPGQPTEVRALGWLRRFGPAACLLSWLPGVGDPLCAVAGWLCCRSGPAWPIWQWASSFATWS